LAEAVASQGLDDEDLPERCLRDLMVRYQRADHRAAEELVTRLTPLLLRFMSYPNHPVSYAEDLLQECWLRIHKARHTYRPDAPVLPWIYAIARHTRLDGYRRQMRRRVREVALGEMPHPPAALRVRETGFSNEVLVGVLNELPESQREVLFMLKVAGMSLQDVACATSSTVGAVKQKAHRAYETLRRKLGSEK
jgi:RNA polymerase sigma-70 factor (ECF subfamily)